MTTRISEVIHAVAGLVPASPHAAATADRAER